MSTEELRKKWDQRYRDGDPGQCEPARVVEEFRHLLPCSGKALELACGLGANALVLARQGLETRAWDISAVAVEKLGQHALAQGLSLEAEVRDAVAAPPGRRSADVIVVSRFLDRGLCPAIQAALKPGGLLFYQTFTQASVECGGPSNPSFRLARNELLALFPELIVLAYREEDLVGDTRQGFRNEAMLVGMKPPLGMVTRR